MTMMRKTILPLILILCMVSGTFAFADSDYKKTDSPVINTDTLASDISTTVSNYYYSKDISGTFNEDPSFTTDIASYLANKVETQQHVTDLYDTNKENYDIDVTLINHIIDANSNIASFEFQVLTTFNYIGCDFDTTVSEVVEVKFDLTTNKIIDLYTPMDYYDEFVRSEDNSISKSSNGGKETNPEFDLTPSVIEKQEQLNQNINSRYNAIASEEIANASIITTRASSLNNTAIVNWARSNYNKNQPSPGKSSVPYFDFSEISGAYDCTNFVSHAVLAGGAKINDTGGSGISSTGWYYRNINNRSSSWSGVDQFYNYMTTNTKANTAYGTTYVYSHNGGMWNLGSVMQFDFDGKNGYNHSTIITKRTSSDGRYYAYVTGRTGDNNYNNNKSADEMSPGYNPRVINVYNR